MDLQHQAVDLAAKAMNVTHRMILAVSGGRLGGSVSGMRAVELHTTGRKSGSRRSSMLTAPIHDDHRTVLVASKGGDDRHPDWYRNLVVDPDIELTVGGVTRPMRARTATPEEKSAMWPGIVATYGGYADYQARTERDIPVVICEPRPT